MPSGAQHDAGRCGRAPRLDPGDLSFLLSTLPDTVVRYDRDGRITYANAEFEHRTGRAVVDAIGSRPFAWSDDRHLVPDRGEYDRMLHEALATGEPRDLTRTRSAPDGHAEIFQVRFQPEIDASGEVVGAWALARNQSRLFQARQEIADREREFRTLAENLPDVVIRYDADARAVYLNRPVDVAGGSGAGPLGLTPTEFEPAVPQVRDYERVLRDVIATGMPATYEKSFIDHTGHEHVHSVLFNPERSEAGAIVGAIAIGRDVTELVRAHRAIADREHQFRTLAENLPEVLVRIDAAERVVYVNERYATEIRPVVADATLDDLTPSHPQGVGLRQRVRRVLHTGTPDQMELNIVARSGDHRVHLVNMAPEFSSGGDVIGTIIIGHDITDLVEARQTAADRERDLRTLAENIPDLVIRYGPDARARYVNRLLDIASGPRTEEIIGRTPLESGPSDMPNLAAYEATLRDVLRTGEPATIEMGFVDAGGSPRTHSVSMRAELDANGTIVGAIAIGRDITAIVDANRAVAERERQFRTLAENATDFIGRWGPDGSRIYVNPALAHLMGGSPEDLIGQSPDPRPDSPYAAATEAILRCLRDGVSRTVQQRFAAPDGDQIHEIRLVPEFGTDGDIVSVLGIGRDISEVVRQREALERAARTDPLTGVASRNVLYDLLPAMLTHRAAVDGRLAVLLVDLDGFKHINDQYGHRLGDRILVGVAERLGMCTGDQDVLIRLGGDEFVIVLGGIDSPTDASLLAHQARMHLAELDGDSDVRFPPIDASVGIAVFPADGDDADQLLAHADLALYDAKRGGRGRVEFFRPELRTAMERRSAIEHALRDCIPDTEMALHLQPICTLDNDPHTWGAEALLRWNHPGLGPVPPDEFIPIAEQSGQIVPIGRWVLRRAAELAAELNAERSHPLHIAVNVSTRQFTLDDIADAVHDALVTTGCDPRWLILELTESLLLEDVPLVRRSLDRLRVLGVAVAIDDFGTGYSALHYLTRLPIDHMKIDKAFVRDVDVDHQQQEIVRALVAMATALDIGIVAEGIETGGQARFMRDLGCRLGQGYLMAKPMPHDDFVEWIATAATTLRETLPV
jgi:diguanylate cyclase (GGDEF)-like protein/PAS domain S-box-containing protein